MTEENIAHEDGSVTVHKMQDVEGLIDRNKELANSGATNIGIRKGFWHYASIPLAVQYEMLIKHGVNVQNKNHYPRLFALINEHYPYLKTTTKHHSLRGGGKVYAASSLKPSDLPKPVTSTAPGNS